MSTGGKRRRACSKSRTHKRNNVHKAGMGMDVGNQCTSLHSKKGCTASNACELCRNGVFKLDVSRCLLSKHESFYGKKKGLLPFSKYNCFLTNGNHFDAIRLHLWVFKDPESATKAIKTYDKLGYMLSKLPLTFVKNHGLENGIPVFENKEYHRVGPITYQEESIDFSCFYSETFRSAIQPEQIDKPDTPKLRPPVTLKVCSKNPRIHVSVPTVLDPPSGHPNWNVTPTTRQLSMLSPRKLDLDEYSNDVFMQEIYDGWRNMNLSTVIDEVNFNFSQDAPTEPTEPAEPINTFGVLPGIEQCNDTPAEVGMTDFFQYENRLYDPHIVLLPAEGEIGFQ